jgi:hypothetical protein
MRLAELGAVPFVQSPEFIADGTEAWREAVKFSGARAN